MKKSNRPSHLELRHNTYFAILYVPRDVQDKIGKTKFSQSTVTGEKRIAQQRADALVIRWQSEISRARGKTDDPIIAEAVDLNYNFKTSSSSLHESVREVIDDRTVQIGAETNEVYAEGFKNIAIGKNLALESFLPEWKEYVSAEGLKQKTIDQMSKDVMFLTDVLPAASIITPEIAEIWINAFAEENRLTASSVNRIIWSCRNFFKFLKMKGEVPEMTPIPFVVPDKYRISKKKNSKTQKKPWIPFKNDEITAIYNSVLSVGDQTLADLIKLGAYTGGRIEELCSIKCNHVDLVMRCFQIVDAKTNAGIRTIPIHSKIRILIERLIKTSEDGYLLSGLTFNKYGDRSNAIGKRFGRLKEKLGFSGRHVFHSIRKTTVTKLENAGVPENIAADIVGHEKTTMTYGLYSGGASLDTMRKSLQKITYDF